MGTVEYNKVVSPSFVATAIASQQDLRPLQQQPSPRNSHRAKVMFRTPRLRCSCDDHTTGSMELVRDEELAFMSLVATCVGGSMELVRWFDFW